jgi:hypothetical protein
MKPSIGMKLLKRDAMTWALKQPEPPDYAAALREANARGYTGQKKAMFVAAAQKIRRGAVALQ